jgi:hypothetical protein
MKAISKAGVTRRSLGLAIVAMPAAAMAQQPPAEDLLASAREQVKGLSEELRNFKVPIATEPSFAFRP